jgi:histone H3/H4
MRETRDDLWCFLVARRAVARACLHLGIASASQEALDTLAELLLAYAERVAAAVSTSAEAGRRSTANVFDALHAVPLCTTPAVQRVYHTHGAGAGGLPAASPVDRSAEEAGDGGASPQPSSPAVHPRPLHASDAAHDLSWKGLAAFMFGPGWEQPLSPEELEEQDGGYLRRERGPGGGPGGGKVGPSSVLADGGFAGGSSLADGEAAVSGAAASGNGHGISESSRGWCAPYPDRLPRFPVSRRRAPPSRGAFADDDESGDGGGEDEDGERGETAGAMTENPFSPSWTALPQAAGDGVGAAQAAAAAGSKRRRDGDGADGEGKEEAEEGPARKRVRISEADPPVAAAADGPGQATGDDEADGSDGPTLLPRFLPPFPPRRRDSAPRPVLEAPAAPAPAGPGGAGTGTGGKGPPAAADEADEGGLAVRSALVSLPGQQWGGPGNAATGAAPLLSVPWGRPDAAGDGGGPGTAAAAGAPAQIVPLGRASGSRVSRILEGSMDGP